MDWAVQNWGRMLKVGAVFQQRLNIFMPLLDTVWTLFEQCLDRVWTFFRQSDRDFIAPDTGHHHPQLFGCGLAAPDDTHDLPFIHDSNPVRQILYLVQIL